MGVLRGHRRSDIVPSNYQLDRYPILFYRVPVRPKDLQKRDGRSLGDPSKKPRRVDLVETCIRMGLPVEPLLGALGTAPYWARNWLPFGHAVQPVTGALLIFQRR